MSKAIEPVKQSLAEYEMSVSPSELQAVILDNVGDQGISVRHLERVTNPSGKSTKWEIPTIDGDVETTGEIEGIIVFHKLSRARWPGEYKGGGESPLCGSKDGFTGEGDPGGKCKDCPYAKFTENSKGENVKPECRFVKQIFIRRPNELLPMVLNVTAVNLQSSSAICSDCSTRERSTTALLRRSTSPQTSRRADSTMRRPTSRRPRSSPTIRLRRWPSTRSSSNPCCSRSS